MLLRMKNFFVVLAALTLTTLVRGDFVVTVNFINYTNPTGLCAECGARLSGVSSPEQLVPICCDEPEIATSSCDNTGDQRCDTRFRWTLRPFGSSLETRPATVLNAEFPPYLFTACNLTTNMCPFSEMSTTFGRGEFGFLGVAQNPLPVPSRGLTAWMGRVQFFIEPIDSGIPNIIDSFLINLEGLELGAGFTEEMTYTGFHNISEMTMSFRVECAPGFCGSDCTASLQANPAVSTCLANGSYVCSYPGLDPANGCNTCLNRILDSTTNCTSCLDANYDPITNCETCINPNYDIEQNCSVCVFGYDISTQCSECVSNRDLSSACTTCSAGWDITTNCSTCLPRRDLATNCLQCIEQDRFINSDCDACVLPEGDPDTLCTTCLIPGRDPNNDCRCFNNKDPITNCSTCLPGWDSRFDCSICVTGRNISSGCTTCIPGYGGYDCVLIVAQPSDEARLHIAYGVVVGILVLMVMLLALVILALLVCYCRNKNSVKHKDIELDPVQNNEDSLTGQELLTNEITTTTTQDAPNNNNTPSAENKVQTSLDYNRISSELDSSANEAYISMAASTEPREVSTNHIEIKPEAGETNFKANGKKTEAIYDSLLPNGATEDNPAVNGATQIGSEDRIGELTNEIQAALSPDQIESHV